MSRPPDSTAGYLPHVDGLRGLAILLVVGYHAFPARVPGGFIGVDVFFVISGYVITRMLRPSVAAGELRFGAFLARRIRRLLPAMVVVTLASLAIGAPILLADEYAQLGGHALASSVYSLNILLWSESGYFDNAAHTKPLLHLWSLAVEEQFYLVWPGMLALAAARRWRAGAWIALLVAISFALNAYWVRFDGAGAFFLPFTRFWELGAGAWLAMSGSGRWSEPGAQGKAWVGAVTLAMALWLIDQDSSFPGWWALLPVGATMLLIDGARERGLVGRTLENRALVRLGLISYPLYLWHWPLLSFASIVLGQPPGPAGAALLVGLAVLLAWLTQLLVERRTRYRRDNASVWIFLSAALATGAVGGLIALQDGYPTRRAATEAYPGDVGHDQFHADAAARFHPCTPAALRHDSLVWRRWVRCLQSQREAPVGVALVGDSHAEHLFPGLAEAAPNANIAYYVRDGLPFAPMGNFDPILEHLVADRDVRIVLVGGHWNARLRAAGSEYVASLRDAVARLARSGKAVRIIGDVPTFDFDPRRCKYSRLGLQARCTEPAAAHRARAALTRATLAPVVGGPRSYIEVVDYFCGTAVCRMNLFDALLYRDANHLNLNGTRYLGAALARAAGIVEERKPQSRMDELSRQPSETARR